MAPARVSSMRPGGARLGKRASPREQGIVGGAVVAEDVGDEIDVEDEAPERGGDAGGDGDEFGDGEAVGGDAVGPGGALAVEGVAVGAAVVLVDRVEVGGGGSAVLLEIGETAVPPGVVAGDAAGARGRRA